MNIKGEIIVIRKSSGVLPLTSMRLAFHLWGFILLATWFPKVYFSFIREQNYIVLGYVS